MRPNEFFISETIRRTSNSQLTFERRRHEQAIDWGSASKPIKKLGLADGTVFTLKAEAPKGFTSPRSIVFLRPLKERLV
jgi:hypothetical protein